MTRAEVLDLLGDMAEWSPQQSGLTAPGFIDQYVRTFAEIDARHARAAAESWYRDGNKWAPSAGELLVLLADLALDIPDWGLVKAQILGHGAPLCDDLPELPDDCPFGECDGDGLVLDWETNTGMPCRCRPLRQEIRRQRRGGHPLVAEFLREVGSLEVADLQGDRTAEAQIRTKWEAFARGTRRQVTHRGIDPAGLPQLERIAKAAAARELRSGAPRRPDFLHLIPGGADDQQEAS